MDLFGGDEATIKARQESVERIGVLTGVRSGAWLVPRDEVTVTVLMKSDSGANTIQSKRIVQRYWLMHWASLYEGVRRAAEADEQKRNNVVQMSLVHGLSGCRLFHKKTPGYILKYAIDLGNETNSESSSTTFLQVMLSTETMEAFM